MELRKESVFLPVPHRCRVLHISDVHFSARTTHEQNRQTIRAVLHLLRQCTPAGAVCITGDLVSRKVSRESLDDSVLLLRRIRRELPDTALLYSMGNHEMDLPADVRGTLLERCRLAGVRVLDNAQYNAGGLCFAGLTLPGEVFRLPNGSYLGLAPITLPMVQHGLGDRPAHKPCIMLAHSPLGFSAYADWGAGLVLSGHVHGGVIRIGNIGLLSPERRFLPRYTKGVFRENGCIMNVSAGIGKLRINNPAEIVCIDILPAERK